MNFDRMEARLARAIPQLPVRNVTAAQAYYRDVLGFAIDWTWGEGGYGSVSRDGTTIYLCSSDGPFEPVWLVIPSSEVDALCARWRANGAVIVSEPEDKPWGSREFTVADLDGHLLRVSRPANASGHVARGWLRGVCMVSRLPSRDEYRELVVAAGWEAFSNLEAARDSLARSLFCVVAESGGRCVGMARVIGDGACFFYIMDVVVLPEFQGRGVGTALMNEVVDYVVRVAPEKALVGLFTTARRSGFYERFGFMGPETWLHGMSAIRLRRAGWGD